MGSFETAPLPLVLVAAAGLGIGMPVSVWLLRRVARGILGRPQAPLGASRYLLALVVGAVALGGGMAATGFLLALRDYRVFTARTHVAEIQCVEMSPARLRLYYVPIGQDGRREATETYDLEGDEWTVGGDVLRFKPFVVRLGVPTAFKVTRVEGRWIKASDATIHKPTAFDRAGGTTAEWLSLYRDGHRGPLGWLIDGAHGQAVSQLPDRRALYNLYVTVNGYALEKKSL